VGQNTGNLPGKYIFSAKTGQNGKIGKSTKLSGSYGIVKHLGINQCPLVKIYAESECSCVAAN
jgi:hypothetical protein